VSWDQGEVPRRPRRWRTVLVAGACVLAVVLLALVARQAATPADPISVDEATPERTVPPPEPAPPPEPPPPGEVPVSVAEDVERRQLGPLMPVATGLTLTVVTVDGRLARVDLDTGDLVRARLLDREEAPVLVPTGDGGVVVVATPWSNGDRGRARYVLAPDQPAVDLGPAMDGFASATPGRVWLADGDGFSGPVGLREVGTDGVVTAELTLPVGVRVHGAVEGGLVVDAAGELVLYDPVTGAGRRLADGRVLALDGNRLARWACDPALTCWLAVGTVDDPDAARIDLGQAEELAAAARPFFSAAALSPDGRWLAFLRAGEALPDFAALDLESGEVSIPPAGSATGGQSFGFAEPFAWSGSWLFTIGDQGVQAWDVESGLVVPIDLDLFQVSALTVQERQAGP
jgi:hypothetical protein